MRFFTPAWHSGDMPDEEAEFVPARYSERLTMISWPILMGVVEDFATNPGFRAVILADEPMRLI